MKATQVTTRVDWQTTRKKVQGDVMPWIDIPMPVSAQETSTYQLSSVNPAIKSQLHMLDSSISTVDIVGNVMREDITLQDDGTHTVVRSRKIPLDPSSAQAAELDKLLHGASRVFNATRAHPIFIGAEDSIRFGLKAYWTDVKSKQEFEASSDVKIGRKRLPGETKPEQALRLKRRADCMTEIKTMDEGIKKRAKEITGQLPTLSKMRSVLTNEAALNKAGLGDLKGLVPSDNRENACKDACATLKAETTKSLQHPDNTWDFSAETERASVRFNQNRGLYPEFIEDSLFTSKREEFVSAKKSHDGTEGPTPKRIGSRDAVYLSVQGLLIPTKEPLPFKESVSSYISSRGYALKPSYPREITIGKDPLRLTYYASIPYDAPVNGGHLLTSKEHQPEKDKNKTTLVQGITKKVPASSVIGLDPGVRCFLTGYSANGETLEIAANFTRNLEEMFVKLATKQTRIYRMKQLVEEQPKNLQKLQPKLDKAKKVYREYNLHITNYVKQVHIEVARFLVSHYKFIILPSFNASSMLPRDHSCLSSATRRAMQAVSHYKFRIILQQEATSYKERKITTTPEIPSAVVLLGTEEYTTKTCARCKLVHKNQGSKKVFVCSSCHFSIGRDVNGAINNLNKYLTAYSP